MALEYSYWNYRLMAKEAKGEVWFDIHEVYYNNDLPTSCSKYPACVSGNSVDDVKEVLSKMTECLEKPIIWYGDRFPKEYRIIETTFTSLLDDIREDRIKHPIKYKWFCFKTEAYCLITNNKLIKWIEYEINKHKNK